MPKQHITAASDQGTGERTEKALSALPMAAPDFMKRPWTALSLTRKSEELYEFCVIVKRFGIARIDDASRFKNHHPIG